MSKPSNVDAQRIIAVLDEAIGRLSSLSRITPELLQMVNENDEALIDVDPRILGLLQSHYDIETKFRQENIGPDDRILELGDPYLAPDADKNALNFSKSIRTVCRNLVADERSVLQIQGCVNDRRSPDVLQFVDTMNQLKGLFLKKLTTALDEENSREKQIEEVTKKLEDLTNTRSAKKQELDNLKQDREKTISSRQDEAEKLREKIGKIKDKFKKTERDIEEDSRNRMDQEKKNHEDKIRNLTAKVESLEGQLKEMKAKNEKDEFNLRKTKQRQEAFFQEVIESYDKELQESTQRKQELLEKAQARKEELEELEEKFRALDAEKARREMEDRIFREKMRKTEAERSHQEQAAEWIQAHWKGYKTRQEFAKMKKGKKKKKKGKKGK
eukprot:CAMPEP_0115011216 /NCGR_PEP_ID=MMETSP0216-20121206/23837_1 /TAXON_ID=223996 /ORGANISM="Protocruzia adherens, Strain Boccale" /LENGTH=385 /DNA_ID=CAMNT_0002379695 /DNA_START=9 /DNA_END=1166 /DNA_ORIENTATION=-